MPDANSYRHSNPLNRKPKVTFREKLRLFQIKKGRIILSLLIRLRCSCSGTIGAGTRVRLGFPNGRAVVFDERSEEFRRSVKESLNGPVQANRSDGTKPGIGIERKNKPTINMKKRSIGKRGNYKLLSVHFIKLAGTSVNSSCRISFASIFPSGPTKIM